MAIGGAVNLDQPEILRAFYTRAGGPQSRLVILPVASALPETGRQYARFFQDLGLSVPPTILDPAERREAFNPGMLGPLRQASGIFFAGGVQARITSILGGTPVEAELHAAFRRGAVVAGTSAGAAVLSAVMLVFGKRGSTPKQSIAQLAPGLGFTDRVIFDQHFRQRDRLGRLLFAVAHHPGVLGVGIDENTAALIEGDILRVIGKNAVTIIDGAGLQVTNIAEVSGTRPVAMSGVCLHILTQGCSYHLVQRSALIPSDRETNAVSSPASLRRL
jgi:cyanophycinase